MSFPGGLCFGSIFIIKSITPGEVINVLVYGDSLIIRMLFPTSRMFSPGFRENCILKESACISALSLGKKKTQLSYSGDEFRRIYLDTSCLV